MLQVSAPIRSPRWVSTRRIFEQKLSDLHNCKDPSQLKQVLAVIYKSNLRTDIFIATKLVSAFSLCRQIGSAVNIFNQIQQPDVQAYNVLIRAHFRNSQPSQALAAFSQMQNYGVRPNVFTYPFLLKGLSRLEIVAAIHGHTEKFGFYKDLLVPNSLIEAYSKCGLMGVYTAKKLFNLTVTRDYVSYNCMISGLVKAGQLMEARELFDEMPERDTVSWNAILDGYVKSGEMTVAFELFENMPMRDSVSWSTMVLGYSKAGDMEMARNLFDNMPVKNMVAWTIIISGYAEKGLVKEAVGLYDQMEEAGLQPDEGALISILAACADSGMVGLGRRVHESVKRNRYNCSIRVFNALVNMYAKCGCLDEALSVFHGMKERNSVSWSTMIHGFGIHGYGEKALQLFSRMTQEGFAPNKVTLLGILCACSHAGLVDEGIRYFYRMQRDYGVIPEIEHYGCVIDLLGRGGRLKEAFRLIRNMPFEPNDKIWGALLAACRKLYAATLAEEELKRLVQLDLTDRGNLSMLSDICAAAGDWTSVASARLRMKNTRSEKPSGASSIELDDEFHEFTMMDRSHPKSDMIYQMIDELSQHLRKLVDQNGKNAVELNVYSFFKSLFPGCQSGPKSPAPEDEGRHSVDVDWRSFRARLVAGERASTTEEPSSVVDPDTVVDQPPPITIGDKWAHTIHEPEKGCLLIATEKLDGVHIFERTVILLLSTGPIGPTGIILNRPSLMSIKEMRSSLALDVVGTFSDRPLFFGGPIEEGFFLVSPEDGKDVVGKSGVFEEVMKGLYYGTKETVGCAAEMVKRNAVEVGDFRFFDGYCLWAREQLRDEIRSGYWTVAACSPNVVGLASVGSVELWEEILGLLGPKKVW
ncbi:hypothetical protein ACH5RR_014264 [Cinchona calisaya]|uniref:Uncharacterized protein n=1 Tax=Cinchona calisaya TaxID=153742 RepID=A0ABD3A502_9GENT